MAGESNPYAAGDKVYNSGSSAATQGAVDPMGYIDRSLNNTPNPGSYTPGVAAGALSTLRSNSDPVEPTAALPPTQTPTPTQSTTTGSITWKMPVEYDLQLEGIQANSEYQNLITQITAQKNSAMQDKVTGLRDLGIGQQSQQRRDLNTHAYRGMARSSGYVNQVDETAQYFNNAKTDLEARFMAALNGAEASMVQGKSSLDSVMEAIYREAAARLANKRVTDPDSGAIKPLPGDPNTPPPLNNSGGNTPTNNSGGGNGGMPRPEPRPLTPPTTTTFRAARGDTLQSIAKKYKISVAELIKLNPGLKRSNGKYEVYSNSKIKVPSR